MQGIEKKSFQSCMFDLNDGQVKGYDLVIRVIGCCKIYCYRHLILWLCE